MFVVQSMCGLGGSAKLHALPLLEQEEACKANQPGPSLFWMVDSEPDFSAREPIFVPLVNSG